MTILSHMNPHAGAVAALLSEEHKHTRAAWPCAHVPARSSFSHFRSYTEVWLLTLTILCAYLHISVTQSFPFLVNAEAAEANIVSVSGSVFYLGSSGRCFEILPVRRHYIQALL